MAQTVHAATTFAVRLPSLTCHWEKNSNYVACLAAKDEQDLLKYYDRLVKADVEVVLFREPDLDNQATSLCFYGTPEARKITSSLPLLFKNKVKEGLVMA